MDSWICPISTVKPSRLEQPLPTVVEVLNLSSAESQAFEFARKMASGAVQDLCAVRVNISMNLLWIYLINFNSDLNIADGKSVKIIDQQQERDDLVLTDGQVDAVSSSLSAGDRLQLDLGQVYDVKRVIFHLQGTASTGTT